MKCKQIVLLMIREIYLLKHIELNGAGRFCVDCQTVISNIMLIHFFNLVEVWMVTINNTKWFQATNDIYNAEQVSSCSSSSVKELWVNVNVAFSKTLPWHLLKSGNYSHGQMIWGYGKCSISFFIQGRRLGTRLF